MPTDSYPARIEQNVINSDGPLIIARGKLTGGSDYTRKMTLKHKKQLLGIDLNLTSHYDAAYLIVSWIRMQRVEVLNIAGPRASRIPRFMIMFCNYTVKKAKVVKKDLTGFFCESPKVKLF